MKRLLIAIALIVIASISYYLSNNWYDAGNEDKAYTYEPKR